uniref:Uncharacterized protein n=1 Tax=Panagrolaimus sp. JU765 TaxID=591449 RepID=A0AC34R9F7_9BILA
MCNNKNETVCPELPAPTPAVEHWCYVGDDGNGCKNHDIAKKQCELSSGTRYCYKHIESLADDTKCTHYSCTSFTYRNYDESGVSNYTRTDGKVDFYGRCSGELCFKTETSNDAIASWINLQVALLMVLFT